MFEVRNFSYFQNELVTFLIDLSLRDPFPCRYTASTLRQSRRIKLKFDFSLKEVSTGES